MAWQNIKVTEKSDTVSFFGSSARSRIEQVIKDIRGIKTLIKDETVSKDMIVRVLTEAQKTLAREHMGDDIYEKCELSPSKKMSNDCKKYQEMVK